MSTFFHKPIGKFFAIFFVVISFLFFQYEARAAITVTQITGAAITTAGATQVTASFTPVVNRLYLMWTIQTIGTTPPTTPTVACANGLTMVQVNTRTFSTNATPLKRITLFRGMKASGLSAGTCTITWGQTTTGHGHVVVEYSGVDTSGTDGSGAVVQSVVGSTDSATAATGLSLSLAAIQSGSTTAGGFSDDDNNSGAIIAGTGYTAGTAFNFNTPATSLRAEWNTTGSATVNVTHRTTANIGGIAVEVKAADTSAPTPNPMTFASAPANDSTTQISMTSTTGTDATTPVNYLFTNDNTSCGVNAGTGGTSSAWQSSTAYSNSGLQANKCYGYTVTARDSTTPTPNTGTASSISSTYTSANTPGTPTLSGATATTLNLTNTENSNPASNPTTNFAVQVVTTSPSDANWLNKWVDTSGNPVAAAVWMTDAQLDAMVLHSLQPSTLYGVKVKARNNDTDETALSAEGQGTTSSAPVTTLSNFVTAEPSNATVAPGTSAQVDSFGLQTSVGADTMTGATVTLASGTGARVATVTITNNGDTVTYCSAAPSGDTATLTSCGIPVSTTNTQFKIKITAIAHTAMPAPPGGPYAVTGKVTAFTSTNAQVVSDTGSATITIDNLSPAGTTGASAAAGNAQVTVSFTNPADSDFQKVIIYCKTASITETPTEGTDPAVDGAACDGTARVKYSGSTSPQTFTGLTNSTTYFFRIYARDTNGNFTDIASTQQVSATPTLTTTTLGNGTDPSNSSIAPSGSATMADSFTLVTSTGTDSITSAVVGLASGTSGGLSLVEITNDAGTVVYGSASNPVSDAPPITLSGLTATTGSTQYKIRITPKSHANMPAPPGATYLVTAKINSFTGTNAQVGSDTAGTTVTIDNLSPNGATSVSGSSGNTQATLNWTTSNSADFNTTSGSVVYRWTGSSAGIEVPAEGSAPSTGDTNAGATVACVISSSGSTALSKIDGTGGSAGCTASALTNGQAYTYKVFQKDTNGNYDVGGLIGTFTPSPTPTTTLGNGSDPAANTIAPGAGATDVDQFTLQTNTSSETVTSVTVDLSTSSGVGLVAITNSSNTVLGSTASPVTGSNIISVSSMSAGTSIATFKVRVTPLAHTAMPAVPGAAYAITAPVTAWAGSFAHAGSDTNTNALTIDNLSPANATAVGGSAGSAQVTLNWTNPADSDYGSQVVLRRAGTAVSDVPVEGSTYTVGNTIGTTTVACVVATPTATCTDTGLTNGTAYHYKTFSKDSNGNYSTGVVPTGSPFTPSLSTFTITSSAGAHGTISPLGVTNVAQNSDQTYTITPSLGYDVATLVVDGSSIATSTSYTFGSVQQNHTIAVTFVLVTPTYTITSSAGTNGTISPLGATVLLQGASQTYNITPTSGYYVDVLTVGGTSVATSTSYTFTNIQADSTINATFALIPPPPGTFAITATAGANGTISPSGVTIVTQGNSQTYTITPNSGYDFATLTVDSVAVATSSTYTFTNVQVNHTIDATFVALPIGAPLPDTGTTRATAIIFSGKAFPRGIISVIDKQLNTEKILGQQEVTGEDGSFRISFVGILQALHSFGLLAKDQAGRMSQSKFFFIDTISSDFVVKDLLLPPTAELEDRQVTRGSNAIVVGSATPSYTIKLELDGILLKDMLAGKDGAYRFEIPTGAFEFGAHTIRTKQVDPLTEKASDFSTPRTLTVSRLIVVQADLNNDGKMDIRDWSIFLSLWGSKNTAGRDRIDFNKDEKIDISDFSIFIRAVRRAK